MDNRHCFRALLSESVYVSHNIVAHFLFLSLSCGIINVEYMVFHLRDLLLCDGQAKLHLTFGQSHPKLAPGRELLISRKEILHLIAGVSGLERAFITVIHRFSLLIALSSKHFVQDRQASYSLIHSDIGPASGQLQIEKDLGLFLCIMRRAS